MTADFIDPEASIRLMQFLTNIISILREAEANSRQRGRFSNPKIYAGDSDMWFLALWDYVESTIVPPSWNKMVTPGSHKPQDAERSHP